MAAQAQTEPLTFEAAARIALEQNIALRQQANNQLSAEATVMERFGAYTPSASINLGADILGGLQFNNLSGEVIDDGVTNISGGLQINYTIFNGFARQNLYKQAIHELAQQSSLTQRAEEAVLFNLASQYLQVLLDEELLRIAQRNVQEQEDNLRVINAQVEAGIRPISDRYDTEAQIKNLEIEVLRRDNTLNNDRAQLAQTLQLEPGKPVRLQKPTWDLEALTNVPLDLNTLFDQAMVNRADFVAQRSGIEATQAGLKVAYSGYYPTLSMYGYAGSRYNSAIFQSVIENGDTVAYPVSFGTQVNAFFTPQAGARLSIPLYSQMSNRAAVQRAKVTRDNAQLTLENLERIIFTEVQQSVQNFSTEQKALTAARAQLVAAEKAFEIQKERFELGNTDLLTFNQSNTNLVRSQSELVAAEYRLMFQQLLVDYFVGRLDVDSFR